MRNKDHARDQVAVLKRFVDGGGYDSSVSVLTYRITLYNEVIRALVMSMVKSQ